MRILVLGAGFGGLELTARLSAELGDDADIVRCAAGPRRTRARSRATCWLSPWFDRDWRSY